MEDKEDIKYLFARYCNHLCTREEYDRFMQIVAEAEHDAKFTALLIQVYKEIECKGREGDGHMVPVEKTLGPVKVKTLKLWTGIAAAVAIVVVLGNWMYAALNLGDRQPDVDHVKAFKYRNDIAPGKNTATLTLANGKVISLDTNVMSVVVTDSIKTSIMLTASTPRGGTYQVVLPDGTKAWLNAASSIHFPSSFAGGKQRRVEMTGEVYFEVANDKNKPFIVETDKQQIEVLGTHFNINSYKDENAIKTTLLEGSVKVMQLSPGNIGKDRRKNIVILEPGQQSVLSDLNRIEVKDVDANSVVDWKNGDFLFKDDFRSLMRKVARWYDVEIIYDASAPTDLPLLGEISRSKNISALLDIIQAAGGVHFTIEGRRVTVKK